MLRDPLVPNDYCTWFITDAAAEVVATIDVIEEEFEHVVFITDQ